MFSWSDPAEEKVLTLGQQATQNISLYRKKKEEHLDQCLQLLIEDTKEEILYQSSLGSTEASLDMDNAIKKFPELVIGTEEKPKTYRLSTCDKKQLFYRLEEHYKDTSTYPHLKCRHLIRGYNNPKYCIRIQMNDPDISSEEIDVPQEMNDTDVSSTEIEVSQE